MQTLQSASSSAIDWWGPNATSLSISLLDEAVAVLRNLFNLNTALVTPYPVAFDAQVDFPDPFGQIGLSRIGLGAGAKWSIDTKHNHLLVTFQIAGQTLAHSQGLERRGGVGFIAIYSTTETVSRQVTADSSTLVLKIPRVLIENLLERIIDGPLSEPLVFLPFPEDSASRQRWWTTLQLLATYATGEQRIPLRQADAVVETVLLTLLSEFPHNYSCALRRDSIARASHRRVDRATAVIRQRYAEQLRLGDLAVESSMSIRSLTQQFREVHGMSPMKYLQDVRLCAARVKLAESCDERSVTRVALDCGFSSVGRFAALYRARFGELPSQTNRR